MPYQTPGIQENVSPGPQRRALRSFSPATATVEHTADCTLLMMMALLCSLASDTEQHSLTLGRATLHSATLLGRALTLRCRLIRLTRPFKQPADRDAAGPPCPPSAVDTQCTPPLHLSIIIYHCCLSCRHPVAPPVSHCRFPSSHACHSRARLTANDSCRCPDFRFPTRPTRRRP